MRLPFRIRQPCVDAIITYWHWMPSRAKLWAFLNDAPLKDDPMPLPLWHEELNHLKPISKLFNWHLNMVLAHPTQKPVHRAARLADICLRNDRNGWTGPLHLTAMFDLLNEPEAAATCKTIGDALFDHNRTHPLTERHLLPAFQWTPSSAELATLTDPEAFPLIPEDTCDTPQQTAKVTAPSPHCPALPSPACSTEPSSQLSTAKLA